MQFDDSLHKIAYEYDELGRIKERALTNGSSAYTTTYTFVAGGYGTNSTTPLVAGITQGTGSNAMNFAYAYDSRGNITSETRNGKETTYTYDALGQLIRVNDPHDTTAGASGTTWVYNYDRGGNILSKSCYAYTTGTPGTAVDTIAYSYTDSNWKDKLTSYDGNEITYDAIGNPLFDGTWMYTWEKSRQLKQMSKSGMTVEFKYDHNGLRTQKTVTSGGEVTVTDYTLHGKLVTHLTRGSDEMHFFYDAQSRPAMVKFNGAVYSYVHNLQGDIVGIVDSAGSLVVEYKYDAWGKPTLVRTLTTEYEALAELNPFRYRGYVWDQEIALYYLRTRYYNALWGRFIQIDNILSNSRSIGKSNLYAYGANVLIPIRDSDGMDAYWITDSSNVGGAGHTSLLVQEEDSWFYFYWGPELEDFSKYAKVYYVEIEIAEDNVLGSVNDQTEITNYAGTYDSAILFKGDFSATAEYCRELVASVEKTGLPTYDVSTKNCMQVSAEAMQQSFQSRDSRFWLFRYIVIIVVPTIALTIIEWFGDEVITGESGQTGIYT